LVGPGNTNHALDGRQQRLSVSSHVVIMENALAQQKNPKAGSASGFVLLQQVDGSARTLWPTLDERP